MDAHAGLSASFHNMEVADDGAATERCEAHCSEQRTEEDIPSDSEIQQRFMELWYQKGELLLYKAFVSRFPNCALWYDQISGSIPPEVEVEIVTSEVFDSHGDTNNKEHLLDEASNKEHCSSRDQEHLYSYADNNEHNYNCASSTEHFCSSKEPDDSNWKDSLHKQAVNKEHIQSEFDNKESRIDESIGKEHVCSGTSKKELFYGVQNNKEQFNSGKSNKEHVHFDKCSEERLQQSDSDKEIQCEGLKVEKTLHENFNIQQGPHHDKNVEERVHEVTDREKLLFSNSNECINNDSDSNDGVCSNKVHSTNVERSVHGITNMEKQLCSNNDECINDSGSKVNVCNDASNRCHSELKRSRSHPTELQEAGEVILKHSIMLEADVMTESRNCSFLNGSCSDSGLSFEGDISSVHDVSSVAGSTLPASLEDDSISNRLSDVENGLVVQLLPHEEHGYTARSFDDHSYTHRTDGSYLSADCEDCLAVDGHSDAEEFGQDELIAWLQEAHDDLKNQVFVYVREVFAEWVRRNPDGEFDVSSLDRDLMAVANPFTEFVDEQ